MSDHLGSLAIPSKLKSIQSTSHLIMHIYYPLFQQEERDKQAFQACALMTNADV